MFDPAIPTAAAATAAAATTALWAVVAGDVEILDPIGGDGLIDEVAGAGTVGTTSTKAFKSELEKFALCFPRMWSFNVSFREYK